MYWASWGVCWINPKFGRCCLLPFVVGLRAYQHPLITGPSNYLTDMLRRNFAGLTENGLQHLRQPTNLTVHTINLNIDQTWHINWRTSPPTKAADQRLARIIESLSKYPPQVNPKYKLLNRILYSMGQKLHPSCRPMLPNTLDNLVIKYVHTILVHLVWINACTKLPTRFILKI